MIFIGVMWMTYWETWWIKRIESLYHEIPVRFIWKFHEKNKVQQEEEEITNFRFVLFSLFLLFIRSFYVRCVVVCLNLCSCAIYICRGIVCYQSMRLVKQRYTIHQNTATKILWSTWYRMLRIQSSIWSIIQRKYMMLLKYSITHRIV